MRAWSAFTGVGVAILLGRLVDLAIAPYVAAALVPLLLAELFLVSGSVRFLGARLAGPDL